MKECVYKKILVLGKSTKFEKVIRALFTDAEVEVLSWRNEKNYLGSPDLIVVCGYDYASNYYRYKDYLNVNVNQPLTFICQIANNRTKVLYINTELTSETTTFSRYRYAKNELAVLLQTKISNFFILNIPTVVNENSSADIFGGITFKTVFNAFIRLKLIKTVTLTEIMCQIHDLLNSSPSSQEVARLKPKWLRLKRTLFIDRLLRVTYG